MKNSRIFLILMIIVLALTGACKLTLKHEIWLQDESSGEVLISAEAEYPRDFGDSPDSTAVQENTLLDYVNFADEFLDIGILDQSIKDLSDEETFHYIFSVRAEFGDLDELGYWLGTQDEQGLRIDTAEDGTIIEIYPVKTEMLSMNRLEGELEDLSFMDIFSEYTVHTPRPLIYAKDADLISDDRKTVTWNDTIDYDFYEGEERIYELKF